MLLSVRINLPALLHVHFLRTALDCVRRKVGEDCLQELRWIYDRLDLELLRKLPSLHLPPLL